MSSIHSIPLSVDISSYLNCAAFDKVELEENKVQINSLLRLSIEDAARDLKRRMGDYFKPHPCGYYLPGRQEPVMLSNEAYYSSLEQGGPVVKLQNSAMVDNAVGPIVDASGRIIVSRGQHSPNNRRLLNTPYIPYYETHALNFALQEQVHDFSKISKGRKFMAVEKIMETIVQDKVFPVVSADTYNLNWDDFDKLKRHLENEALVLFKEDLERHLQEVLYQHSVEVWSFLKNDVWLYHFANVRNGVFEVRKGEDYRIHQWSIEHASEYE